jgi:GNAT superfamily N-acetyltransferase
MLATSLAPAQLDFRVRHTLPSDAEALLDLRLALDHETPYMLLEPGERSTDTEQQRLKLRVLLSAANGTGYVAEVAGQLVGFLNARGGEFRRNRHCVNVVVGVRQAYTGHGIGSALFAALEVWARGRGVTRMEVSVVCNNERALALYQSVGFDIEGRKRAALQVDGAAIDELLLGKLLDTSGA